MKGEEKRQRGTATYLIDKFALRVGNEKSEDEADTVGCCSLRYFFYSLKIYFKRREKIISFKGLKIFYLYRVEHVTIETENRITLDFLGKDSMRYHNTVTVEEIVWRNLNSFVKGKKAEDNVFDKINVKYFFFIIQ